MSEEEKKAIEWLEKAEFFSARLYAPIILNLLNNYKKEIEELKEITREYNAFNGAIEDRIIIADDRYFNSGYFKNNYIPKQKIINILNYLNDTDLNNYEIVMAFKKMMKELLEENDGDHIPKID